MERLACALIGFALLMTTALVGLLLTDAMAPLRLPPLFGFYTATLAGVMLILGLVLLVNRDEQKTVPAFERLG